MIDMDDKITVHTTYSVDYADLPQPISDYVHEVCCEWGIGSGERISFESVLEYFDGLDTQEGIDKSHLINQFIKKNDLDDAEYLIDLDW